MLKNLDFQYTKEEKQKLLELRALIEADKSLSIGTEDVLLSKFLNHTQWQVDAAFKDIHGYYDFKIRYPEWIAQDPVERFREMFFYTQSKFIMPKPARDGRVIIVFKLLDAFDKYPDLFKKNIQLDDMIFEAVNITPQAQKYGITAIYDITKVTANIIKYLSPHNARTIDRKNSIFPLSSLHIHYIQKGVIMNAVLSIFKNCLNKKMKDSMFSHDVNNFEKLQDSLGYENTPAIYGGPPENILDDNHTFDYLIEHEKYLLQLQSYHKKESTK